MADWETAPANLSLEETSGALTDVTNVSTSNRQELPNIQSKDTVKEDDDSFDPQARGWVKPRQYDYDSYTKDFQAPQDPANLESGEIPAEQVHGVIDPAALPSWASAAARYEWSEEYGEVAPRVPQLEEQLFRGGFRNRLGEKMSALEFEVHVESEEKIQPVANFEDAGLHPVMLENIKLCSYARPTPIQAYTIPAVLTGHDLIAVAQTGSGKTAAFLIPILSKLMGKAKKLTAPKPKMGEGFNVRLDGITAEPLVLVIVPTRELACQIFDEARRLCYRSMLRPCVVYGGGPVMHQKDELAKGCDILIGTVGRLVDFMGRGKILSFRRVKYTVLDEADEMVTPEWLEGVNQLLSGGDNNEDADHRYMMFSATFPKAAQELAKKYLDDGNVRIKVGRAGSTHKNIFQHIVYTENEKKRDCLRDLLRSTQPVRTIIFVNAKHVADEIDDFLFNQGFPSTSLHGDRTQREREDALKGFRSGESPILVTTGVFARGLDVWDVGHIVNYDLPKADQGGLNEYVHRIGRTARIGNVGIATSFYNEDDEGIARRLVKLLIESELPIPEFLEEFMPEDTKVLDFEADEEDIGFNAGGDDANGGGDASGWGEGNDTSTGGAGGWGNENMDSNNDDGNADVSADAAPSHAEQLW